MELRAVVAKVTQQTSGLLVATFPCAFPWFLTPLQVVQEVRATHQTLTTAEREMGAEQRWSSGDE